MEYNKHVLDAKSIHAKSIHISGCFITSNIKKSTLSIVSLLNKLVLVPVLVPVYCSNLLLIFYYFFVSLTVLHTLSISFLSSLIFPLLCLLIFLLLKHNHYLFSSLVAIADHLGLWWWIGL